MRLSARFFEESYGRVNGLRPGRGDARVVVMAGNRPTCSSTLPEDEFWRMRRDEPLERFSARELHLNDVPLDVDGFKVRTTVPGSQILQV